MPAYPFWQLWMLFGLLRAVLFIIAARLDFGYIVYLCPEPFFAPVELGLIWKWLPFIFIADTWLVGYVFTFLLSKVRRQRPPNA
ncbi:MAG: hypothetical protein JO117_08705 [Verrucomicrobia bacterium]|nr:hypothetical protein [Verrucomicrobiota bacterium]